MPNLPPTGRQAGALWGLGSDPHVNGSIDHVPGLERRRGDEGPR